MLPDYTFDPDATVRADDGGLLPAKTYRYDPETGKIGGFCDGIDAMKQAIRKRLTTPRGHLPIYSPSYGSELWRLCGRGTDYVISLLPTYVRAALYDDDRVKSVDGFTFSQAHGTLFCAFTVHTVLGSCELTVTTQP